jgi:hypothetical protein
VRIHIVLHTSLRELLPEESKGRATIDLPDGVQIRRIMEMYRIPSNVVCAINDQVESDRKRILIEGDILHFLHPSAGG